MKVTVFARKMVPEALAVLAGGPVTSEQLRRVAPIDMRALALLRREGLVKFSVKKFVEEVPMRVKRLTYGLTEKGRRMMELHARLSETEGRGPTADHVQTMRVYEPSPRGQKNLQGHTERPVHCAQLSSTEGLDRQAGG